MAELNHKQNDAATFSVIFTARLRSELKRSSAIRALNKFFKLEDAQIQSLISHAPRAIKRDLSRENANKIVKALWKSGWHSELRDGEQIVYSTLKDTTLESPKPQLRPVDNGQERKLKRLKSDEGDFSICIPVTWEPLSNLNNSACLQVGCQKSESFAIIIRRAKYELGEEVQLEHYASAVTETAAQGIESGIVMTDTQLKGNAGRAVYAASEIRGKVRGTQVYYSLATYDSDVFFYTGYFWCSVVNFPKWKKTFNMLAASFVLL